MDEKEAEARPIMGTIFLVIVTIRYMVCFLRFLKNKAKHTSNFWIYDQ